VGSRNTATTLAAAVLVTGSLSTTTGLLLAPTADASCASLFGFSTDPARCTSSPLGIAIAIGKGAGARAGGLLGAAFAAGPDSYAEANSGAINVALQLGANGTTLADGFLNFAVNVSMGTTDGGGSEVRAQGGFGNIAINLFGDGTGLRGSQVHADGILNFAANLGGTDNVVLAGRDSDNGTLNAAVSMLGTRSAVVAADGFLNAAAQFGGTDNQVYAQNGAAQAAAQLGGTGNQVYAQNGAAQAAAQLGGTGNQVYAQNGAAQAAAQLGGTGNQVYAQNGAAQAAAQLGGTGNSVRSANGAVNAASQIGGDYNSVTSGGAGGVDGYFTVAFSALSNGRGALEQNTVLAGPGPLAVAGSIGQYAANIVQSGPGININRSSAIASPRRSPAAVRSAAIAANNRAKTTRAVGAGASGRG